MARGAPQLTLIEEGEYGCPGEVDAEGGGDLRQEGPDLRLTHQGDGGHVTLRQRQHQAAPGVVHPRVRPFRRRKFQYPPRAGLQGVKAPVIYTCPRKGLRRGIIIDLSDLASSLSDIILTIPVTEENH